MTRAKTKRELLQELQELLDGMNMDHLDGINANSTKDTLQSAINCLRCSDEQMAEYLVIIKLKYPNTYKTITASNYLRHRFNRLYVYDTARLVLSGN